MFQNQPTFFSVRIPAIELIDSKHHFYIFSLKKKTITYI